MNLVTLRDVSHQYSERLLFDQANLLVNQGDRIGLIGVNGSGKTTLLRLVAGLESPHAGSVTVWGGVVVRYLPQEPPLDPGKTVLQTLFDSDAPALRLLQQYQLASRQLARQPHDEALQARLLALAEEMERANGWAAEAQAKAILTRLGITDFEALIGTLSGGQAKRVALARALLEPGDLLLLDEPTNHIDAEAIEWLEGFLREMPAALLMVTHDRYFLDRVANRIVEIDRRELVNFPGNYRAYLELRQQRQEQLRQTEFKHQALLRRELEWIRRGAMARSTKQKARKQRFEALQTIRYDSGEDRVTLALASRRLGKKVLRARGLSKSFGPLALFSGVDFDLVPGDRLGLIGPNGAGKSTFLDILAGVLPADAGTLEWGETVRLGYYDQQSRGLPLQQKAIDFINDTAPLIRTADGYRVEAAQMLEWFLFPRPQQQAQIGSLSGGEKRRLYLLHVLARQPNVLFLDEPTNDLDIPTLQVLESFLDAFRGCLIVVSHDRYFLDRTVDYLATFAQGGLSSRYPAPFSSYLRLRAQVEASQPEPETPPAPAPVPAAAPPTPASPRLTWKQRRELEQVEARIAALEQTQATLRADINQSGGDYSRLHTLAEALQALEEELEGEMARWTALSELAEGQEQP